MNTTAQVDAGGVKVYVTDHLGSTLNSVAAGTAKAYSPWGELLVSAPVITNTTDAMVYGLGGCTVNLESATLTCGTRELDPTSGTWLQPDPIGFAGADPNVYRYVLNSPLVYVDPSGLLFEQYFAKQLTSQEQLVVGKVLQLVGGLGVALALLNSKAGWPAGVVGLASLAIFIEGSANVLKAQERMTLESLTLFEVKLRQNSCPAGGPV